MTPYKDISTSELEYERDRILAQEELRGGLWIWKKIKLDNIEEELEIRRRLCK